MEKFPFTPVVQEDSGKIVDERSRLYNLIINSTDLLIITTDPRGIITSINRSAADLLNYEPSDVVGTMPLLKLHDPHEIQRRTDAVPGTFGVSRGFDALVYYAQSRNAFDRNNWTYVSCDGLRIPVVACISSLWEEDYHVGYVAIASIIAEDDGYQERQLEIQAQLQALIASIDDIVFELDRSGRFTQIWVKSDEYLFKPRNEIIGKTLSEIFGQDFAATFEDGFRRVIDHGEPFVWEYQAPQAGDSRWFSAKCAMVLENGKPTNRVSVCIQNITDRKTMELSLRESEEKFRLLAESIPGVVFMMDAHAILYVNNKIESITGHNVDEFYHKLIHFNELIHEDDRTYVMNVRTKSLEDRQSYNIEYRIIHKSGIPKWVSETGVGVISEERTLLEGFIADISQRKEAEEEMRRMADENSRIFNNSITLSAIAGFDGSFKKLNPAWEKTLGWTRDELLSNALTFFIHNDDTKKTTEIFEVIATGQKITMFENRVRCKDGSYRWLLWQASPDIARKVIYASAIDITSRKKSEDELLLSKRNLEAAAYELEEQNRQLDEFAHIISHNLRAPVANIKALLNFIDDTSQVGDYQLIFEKIRNVTHNISETMNELMETIKIRKTHEIERVEIRFKDILDKVIQSLEGELIESGATITYNFNNAPKIYYSKPYLESILQNLISNAIKYRSPKRIPEIFISTDLVMSGIELRVQDNGLGIDLNKFGEKLFGLHKTFHENKEARGVGLFLTKTQIETLGGNIKAESTVDGGTTFVIQF